jgi:phosphinothricin acetyltransferase
VQAAPRLALEIRDLRPAHWPEVARIYAEGIRSGATFATRPPSWEAWDRAHTLRLVAVVEGRVVGWAALEPVSERYVYRGVARSAVYVAESARGRGIGRALMAELIERAESAGIWTIEAGLFPENVPSLRLHQALGFRVVGVRERLGQRGGVWHDVLLLERRSEVVE